MKVIVKLGFIIIFYHCSLYMPNISNINIIIIIIVLLLTINIIIIIHIIIIVIDIIYAYFNVSLYHVVSLKLLHRFAFV